VDDLRGERKLWCEIIKLAVQDFYMHRSKATENFLRSPEIRFVMDSLNLPTDEIMRKIDDVPGYAMRTKRIA